MLLNEFTWIADENIHPEVCYEISEFAKVYTLKELGLLGSTDTEILIKAQAINALILTHDSDFGKLAFLDKRQFIGVVFLRPGHLSPDFHMITIRKILEQQIEVQPPFIIVGLHTNFQVNIRIRNMVGEY